MRQIFYKLGYKIARFYWWLSKPKTFGVRCIIKDNNEIILVRHSYVNNKLWSLPGGSLKNGEDPEQALVRELSEELGLKIKDYRRIGTIERTAEYKRDTVYCFVVSVENRSFQIDNKEILEARWFPLANMPDQLSPFTRSVLAMWRQS